MLLVLKASSALLENALGLLLLTQLTLPAQL